MNLQRRLAFIANSELSFKFELKILCLKLINTNEKGQIGVNSEFKLGRGVNCEFKIEISFNFMFKVVMSVNSRFKVGITVNLMCKFEILSLNAELTIRNGLSPPRKGYLLIKTVLLKIFH